MNDKYEPKEIEPKWQKYWEESNTHQALDESSKPKFYALIEFPYPSGDGLHVGHPRPYIGMDLVARKRRMQGYNVLYPIGWDAFGLPTENYALKTGKDPREVTKENSDTFRRQIKNLGISFDWSREINTTDPKYYKWTQWIFLQFLKHDLAYKAKTEINWCPKDKIGLANEEVVGGLCERCGTPVEKRLKEQWILRITKYADRLDKDLDELDYQERIKLSQKNWIGRSEGAEISFEVKGFKTLEVFTTRPDTIFGATFLVLAPEHAFINEILDTISNKKEVLNYIENSKKKTDIERTSEGKEKTGIEIKGIKAINPASKVEIPIWIADYVLPLYGTGAIMAVPAHDQRDFEFAKKFNIDIKPVIAPYFLDTTKNSKPRDGAETKNRNIAVGIVKHWSEDKYLMLDWKNGWTGFITGGTEVGENIEETIIREIKEETGYSKVRFVKTLGGPNISDFYAPHKNLNQHVFGYGVYLELIDNSKENVRDEELEKHSVVWVDKNEVMSFLKKGSPMGDSRYSEMFWERLQTENFVWQDEGILINSGEFDGVTSEKAGEKIIKYVHGKKVTKFKLRDWIFSRQRYWGEPIPVIHCEKCGIVPVPEKDLPVELPHVEKYEPTDTGESPLANISEWVNVKCPQCDGDGKRETDVMPNWAGSSWYFLRYTDPHNDNEFASQDNLKHWMPVDWYNGGMEHTTLHLLYSRFWNKFLFDIGLVPTNEPYNKRTSHGLILAEGGEKMSKSKGNVINPDDIVDRFGADTLRLYEMFMGPFDQAIAWSEDSLVGPRRFIEKIWKLAQRVDRENIAVNEISLNQVIKKVGDDIEEMKFNTAISAMMVYVNELEKKNIISKKEFETLVLLLSPFAPHVAEELWSNLDNKESVGTEKWPVYDENMIQNREVNIAIQVNGKTRAILKITNNLSDDEVRSLALNMPEILRWVKEKPQKVIVVPNKVVNIVL
jgi:leucyl-tRNA synthetase